MSHFRVSLSSLPSELIEDIIILSTLLGDTRAPSTLAQTCRLFRSLVYYQQHSHLWREMFLILFDDPRPACNVHTHGSASPRLNFCNKSKGKLKDCPANYGFPWEEEYKLRIWTESFILRRTQPALSGSHDTSSDLPSTDADLCTVLETLLRVVLTVAPLPHHVLASLASHCQTPSLPHSHPIFSPVLIAAHLQPSRFLSSRNTLWLARVFKRGLPRVLLARLSAFDENGQVDIQKKPVKWDGLLAKLVAQAGLMIPITANVDSSGQQDHTKHEHNDANDRQMTPDSSGAHYSSSLGDDHSSFEPQHESERLGDQVSDNDINSNEVVDTVMVSATKSLDDVRRLARVRVYNMSYPHPSRFFGPFLPFETHHEMSVDNSSGLSINTPLLVSPIPDTNSFLGAVAGAVGSNRNSESNNGGNENAAGNNGGEAAPISSLFAISVPGLTGPRHMDAPSVSSDQLLRFDWAWISAARQVIELNLRDLLRSGRHQCVLRALLSLEGIRSCSAPGFPASAPEAAAGEDGRTFEDGEGWDWAGVAGQWRRCVCWMDYRELISNNAKPLAERFSNPALNEAMRIFPFTVRITHYSRGHASWPGRPKIHFEGEMLQDTTALTAMTPDGVTRRLHGTVQMAASGDVHMSLERYRENSNVRWASEAVQIGGLGSGMGFIGLWTNAEHQLSEPVGPFWAWKVGPPNVCPNLAQRSQAPVPYHDVGGSNHTDDAQRA